MSALRTSLLWVVVCTLFGCSPGHFVGSGDSQRKLPRYQKISQECRNLHLSGDRFTVSSFRGLFGCLNSNDLFGPAGKYIAETSDENLEPLVGVVNEGVLSQPRLFFELKSNFDRMEESGDTDRLFILIADFLEHLHESAIPFARLANRSGHFPELLPLIRWAGRAFEPRNARDALSLTKGFFDSSVFSSLRAVDLDIDDNWVKHFQVFWKDELKTHVVERLFKAISAGSIYPVMDPYVADLNNDRDAEVSQFFSLWKFFWSGNRGRDITEYFHLSNQPLSCFRGTMHLESYSSFVLNELASVDDLERLSDYCQRIFSSGIFLGRSVCGFPPEIGKYADVIHEFSGSMALAPISTFLQRIKRASPEVFQLLHDILAELGNPNGGAYHVFKKLEDQDVWRNLILLSILHGDETRPIFSRLAASLIEDVEGQKPIRMIAGMFANASPAQLKQWFLEMEPIWDTLFEKIPSWSETIKTFFEKDRTHPISELASVSLSVFAKNDRFFNLLLEDREGTNLDSSLKHLAEMSRNGQLKEIIGSIFRIFGELSERGSYALDMRTDPIASPSLRHNYDASDFTTQAFGRIPLKIDPACDALDMDFDILQFNRTDYRRQFTLYSKCINSRGDYPKLTKALDTWLDPPTGGTLPRVGMLLSEIQFFSGELGDWEITILLNAARTGYSDGSFKSFVNSFKSWSDFSDASSLGTEKNVLSLWVDWIRSFIVPGEKLNEALQWMSRTLQYDGFSSFLKSIWKWSKTEETPLPKSPLRLDQSQLENWVRLIECDRADRRGTAWVSQRAQELQEDIRNTVNAWEWNGDGPRRSWEFNELWAHLGPVLKRVQNKEEQAPSDLIYSIRNILRLFGRVPGQKKDRYSQFTPEEFLKWMTSLAQDHRLITYYYPGRSTPYARVVNGFDRFEIILHNADLVPFFRKNMGLKYLDMLAHAWGDEPRENWPIEIQQEYRRSAPLTLRETFQSIRKDLLRYKSLAGSPRGLDCWRSSQVQNLQVEENASEMTESFEDDIELQQYLEQNGLRNAEGGWVDEKGDRIRLTKDGLPFMPKEYQERLFNAFQVIGVFEENLPDSSGNGGVGMRILRNLAFEMMNSTPVADRDPQDGAKNNLSLILSLGKAGLLRHLGWALSEVPQNSKMHLSVLRVLSTVAGHSEFEEIAKEIFQDPLALKRWERVLKEIFQLIEKDGAAEDLRQNSIYIASFIDEILSNSSHGFKESMFRLVRGLGPSLRSELPRLLDSSESIRLNLGALAESVIWRRSAREAFGEHRRLIDRVLEDPVGLANVAGYAMNRIFDPIVMKKHVLYRSADRAWIGEQSSDLDFDEILTLAIFNGNESRDQLLNQMVRAAGKLLDPSREQTQVWISDFYSNPNAYYQVLRVLGELTENEDHDLFFRIFMGLTDSPRLTGPLSAP